MLTYLLLEWLSVCKCIMDGCVAVLLCSMYITHLLPVMEQRKINLHWCAVTFFAKNKKNITSAQKCTSTWRCFLFKGDDDTVPMLLVFLKKQASVKTAFVCCLMTALGHAAVMFLSICLLWNRACGNAAVQTWSEWPYRVKSLELVPNLYLYAFQCFYSLSSGRASKTNPLKSNAGKKKKKSFLEYHWQRTD